MRRVKDGGVRIAPAIALVALVALGGLIALGGTGLCGCGGSAATGGDDGLTRRHLAVVAVLYGEYLQAHNNVPPKDEAAFRSFLNENGASLLREYNVDDVDKLLTSPRDGQRFKVVYGKRLAPADSPGKPWAAYEKTGVDGKRMAAQVRGATEELSSEQIAAQFPAE